MPLRMPLRMPLHLPSAIALVLGALTVSGCASGVKTLHAFGGCNHSMDIIHQAVISYSGQTYDVLGIPAASTSCHPARRGLMDIPETMTIAWTNANNIRHVVQAPVAQKIDDPSRLLSVLAYIYQDRVDVIQEFRGDNGYVQKKKIYPADPAGPALNTPPTP